MLADLQNRGLEDIFIACIDNLQGFADAIESVFPHTENLPRLSGYFQYNKHPPDFYTINIIEGFTGNCALSPNRKAPSSRKTPS
jgi:hypothetical protein